ncbi:Similar to BEST2: Bestrophin-2 (Homo sapiens) [Cotesia congregata]|uniref:Bestrophin homolog n=1 Tax=Cotesia congregata TaxID=51543 RepID=A0A8J2HMV6_COTCN|nr:Similar to BEST2: Bestrophin-2 (Homo sapiens) [Cotesia congregata]
MTVSYQYEVASSTSGGFTRLLFMWRGSLYKLIYRELLLFLVVFGIISVIYRHALTTPHKRAFERIVIYCDTFVSLIPLSFVLGFYVAYVAGRWWQQYMAIPWPDKVMHLVALYVTGNDEYGRMLRRSLMRYLNLSLILVLRSISSAVKRRFPTLDHVVDSGFMTALELELFQSVPSLEFNTYWIPCTWFINLLKESRRTHRLPDPQGLKIIMEEFNEFRSKCGLLWSYDWVSIPLVYTQVVTLATYSFFVVALVGRQYIEGSKKPFQMALDAYLPIFTILQFFFYMGLLKVAEQLINPFGDDDEDFELNWLIDRHTKVSYLGVDTLMNRCPPLVKDFYFDSENIVLPYTEAAAAYKRKTYRGSVANMTVPEEKQTMFLPDIIEEEDETSHPATPKTSSIIGSPSATPKKTESTTETIIQLDNPEPVESLASELSIDRSQHTPGAVKRNSRSLQWLELNRKRFIPLAKLSRVSVQPWPSATNLQESTLSYETPKSSSLQSPPPSISVSCGSDEPNDDLQGFFNSAFSQEHLPDTDKSLKQQASEESNSAVASKSKKSRTRFLVRRQSSVSSSKKRKIFRWKRPLDSTQSRRKTTDCVPSPADIIPQTSSSPDLESFTAIDVIIPPRAASEDRDHALDLFTKD